MANSGSAPPTGAAKPAALAAVLIGILVLPGCKPAESARPAAPQPVQVMSVQASPSLIKWSYVGVVRPRTETELGFRVAGKIVERLVDVGQKADAGQVIARLDPTDYRLAVEAQQAELLAARSNLDQAVAAEGRYRTLMTQGHVAQAALELRTAAADEARGRVERAERALSLAENQLRYAELKADRSGVVAALPAETGQVVAAGQTVARIAHLDSVEVEVAVPEHMVEAIKIAKASVEIWGGTLGRQLAASLREISPEADRASRTFRIRFTIEGSPDVGLGRTATVQLSRRGDDSIVRVPLAAVMNDGRGAAVWIVDGDGARVRRVPVIIASLTRDHALIASGLNTGDRIVALGVHMLDEAKPIRIVERRAAIE